MRGISLSDGPPLEYCILENVRAAGRRIGFLGEQEIAQAIVDKYGRHFVYAGVAPRKPNGQFDRNALATGEFIVRPGLIYRYVS